MTSSGLLFQVTATDGAARRGRLATAHGVVNTPAISLGVYDLSAGDHRLTIQLHGAHAKAVKAYLFALDYVALYPLE